MQGEWTDGDMDSTTGIAAATDVTWGVVARLLFPVMGWAGFVLVGMGLLMALLDWGELSGLEPEPSRRRLVARSVMACGVVLGLVGLIGSLVT